ncbi:MAG: carboxylesterase family protein [Gammaproteobacteria bacterium]|jgi:para-nitrobenzyl esterase|nr:carboxylesterase family protein [Gammaproteobacteria bacterium]
MSFHGSGFGRLAGLAGGLLLVWLAGCQSAPPAGPTADVAGGMLGGRTENGVHVFRGIPYVAAPTGARRWRAPQPAPAWSGVHDAGSFGPACPQPARRDRPNGVRDTAEDCLYLNVWAPPNAVAAPVMVWIHGGAFRLGAGSQPFYDGSSFAANGVILVTFNYRLGRLGFFAHPSLEENGNFGLMDQAAALQWVQDNIAAFGGDPDNVTVFGESAGGASVLYLLTSPKTDGLFSKAAVQSGGGLQVTRHLTRHRGQRPSLLAAGVEWQGRDVSAAELRALPVDTVLGEGRIGGMGAVGPVIDGEWVVADPGTRLLAGEFHPVPVLVGSNGHEASVLAAFGTDAARAVNAAGVSREDLGGLYPDDDWAARAWGDAAFVSGARFIARQVAEAGEEAFLYHFDYVLARRRGKVPGAGHGSEIPFVFNTLDALPMSGLLVTDADRAMARRLHSHWLSFARSGDPAGRAEGYWPAYTAANGTLLFIGEHVEARAGFRRAQLDFHEQRWQRTQGGN